MAADARLCSASGSSQAPESIASDSTDRSSRITVVGSRPPINGASGVTGVGRVRDPQRVADLSGHHLHRHRGGAFEDSPLVVQRTGGVFVVGVDARLMDAADHQHRRPQHDQRPQRLDLGGPSGRTASKASMAGSVAAGSPPSWRSSDETATASSDTVHDRVRSPRSMIPSGMRPVCSVLHTTLSSVMSPWITWTGRSSPRSATMRQAAAAAASTASRRWVSVTWVARTSTVRIAWPQVPLQDAVDAGVLEFRQRTAGAAGQGAQRGRPIRGDVLRAAHRAAGQVGDDPRVEDRAVVTRATRRSAGARAARRSSPPAPPTRSGR